MRTEPLIFTVDSLPTSVVFRLNASAFALFGSIPCPLLREGTEDQENSTCLAEVSSAKSYRSFNFPDFRIEKLPKYQHSSWTMNEESSFHKRLLNDFAECRRRRSLSIKGRTRKFAVGMGETVVSQERYRNWKNGVWKKFASRKSGLATLRPPGLRSSLVRSN